MLDKQEKKNGYIKIIIRLLLIIFFLIISLNPINIEAKSVSEKTVRTAYAEFLGNHPSKTFGDMYNDASFEPENKTYINRFMIYDIDGDGKEELFTITNVNFRWCIIRGYRYDGGQVTRLKFKNGKNVVFNDCATAAGGYSFYICKKGHVHNEWYGDWLGENKYVYSKYENGLRKYLSYENDKLMDQKKVLRYGKVISEKRFNTLTAKCKAKLSKGYLNTKSNREKLKEMKL